MNKNGFAGADGRAGIFTGTASAAELFVYNRAGNAAALFGVNGSVRAAFAANHAALIISPGQTFSFFNPGQADLSVLLLLLCQRTDGSGRADL